VDFQGIKKTESTQSKACTDLKEKQGPTL